MTPDDDPFGRSDRTIIRPNPAGRRTPPPSPGDPAAGSPAGGPRQPRRRRRLSPIRRRRRRAVQRASIRPARGRRVGRLDDPASAEQPLCRSRSVGADDACAHVAACVRRPRYGGCEPAHAGGRVASRHAGALARIAGARGAKPAHGSGRAGDRAIRNRRSRGRRSQRSDRNGEICARRHRRRHRAKFADRRQPGLDAVQHAGSLLQRTDGWRPFLQGA